MADRNQRARALYRDLVRIIETVQALDIRADPELHRRLRGIGTRSDPS